MSQRNGTIPIHRQAKSAATRAAILRAAERAFAGAGLAGARTDAIAADAGVNKAMLYYHFKGKDDLYQAVVVDHFRHFNQQALEVLESPGSPSDILLRYVAMHFDFISNHRRHVSLYHQMMMSGGKPLQELVTNYFAPRSRAMGKVLERGMREGQFRSVDRFHTAVSIVGLIVQYFSSEKIMLAMGHSDAYTPAALRRRKREVLDFIRHALFVNPRE